MNKEKDYSLSFVVNVTVRATSEYEAWDKVTNSLNIKDSTYLDTSCELCAGVYDPVTGEEIDKNED